jgi:hypothetical protein
MKTPQAYGETNLITYLTIVSCHPAELHLGLTPQPRFAGRSTEHFLNSCYFMISLLRDAEVKELAEEVRKHPRLQAIRV